jgi:hypothetical protein
MDTPKQPRPLPPPLGMLVIGSEIAGFAVVGIVLDYLLGNFDGLPWMTLILSPLGLLVAGWHLRQLVRPRGPSSPSP